MYVINGDDFGYGKYIGYVGSDCDCGALRYTSSAWWSAGDPLGACSGVMTLACYIRLLTELVM